MKKILAFAVAIVMILSLAACGSPEEVQPEEQVNYEIAMVTGCVSSGDRQCGVRWCKAGCG